MSTRVLVVEDEQSLAKVVASYLQRDGHEVDCVFDGPAAVAAARRHPPDVIVLDLGLPGLDGIEVCRQVRTFSDCYVVILTARADEVDKLVGLGVGANDFTRQSVAMASACIMMGCRGCGTRPSTSTGAPCTPRSWTPPPRWSPSTG